MYSAVFKGAARKEKFEKDTHQAIVSQIFK